MLTISSLFENKLHSAQIFLGKSSNLPTVSEYSNKEYQSETQIEELISYSENIKHSLSLSLTFVRKKSVSFSISSSKSITFYMSFDEIKGTFIAISTQGDFLFYLPYIIHYYSPKYVATNIIIEIPKKKNGLQEQNLLELFVDLHLFSSFSYLS